MSVPVDYKDLYLKYPGHDKYNSYRIVEDDTIEVIEQKLEMILFASKGDLYGEVNFGCDLEYYLWQTRLDTPQIKRYITDQISEYIPELNEIGYTIDVKIYDGTVRDIMFIQIVIRGYNLEYIFT